MNKGTTCKDCQRPIAWGQKNEKGEPLDDKCRLKTCWECSKKRRDARKPQ